MHVTGILTRAISPARRVAFETLEAVETGAFASDTLREYSRPLSPRDAALASQIVFGSLRWQSQLDYLILLYGGRPAAGLHKPVQLALRAAIFQLRYLERIPPHAAVHESVEFVKSRKRAAAGFTNAVLRKVNREPVRWPDAATELSCPPWLLTRWSHHFGPEAARQIALAALQEPAAFVRVDPNAALPQDVSLAETEVAGAYRLLSELPPGMRLHDISSQSVIPLLAIRPADRYLDLCAAPGNKTLQALESSPALAIACDISLKRLRDVPPVCPRVVLDASQPLPFGISFDRIFVDAPCSGTGTLAHNPEIKWRLQPDELPRFQQRQAAILLEASAVLAPGGRLLYASCSLEEEENEVVIRQFLEKNPAFQRTLERWRIPGRDEGDGFYAAIIERIGPK